MKSNVCRIGDHSRGRSWKARLLFAAKCVCLLQLAGNVLFSQVSLISSQHNYPGGAALSLLHRTLPHTAGSLFPYFLISLFTTTVFTVYIAFHSTFRSILTRSPVLTLYLLSFLYILISIFHFYSYFSLLNYQLRNIPQFT